MVFARALLSVDGADYRPPLLRRYSADRLSILADANKQLH